MTVNTLLLQLAAALICTICYLAAGTIYDFHFRLKSGGSSLSKVVTGDRKNLDDKTQWVKRYRIKVLILLVLVVVVPIIALLVNQTA